MDIDYTFAQMLYLCIAPRSTALQQFPTAPTAPTRLQKVLHFVGPRGKSIS